MGSACFSTLWYRPAISALMAQTSAAMSSTKRSGKRCLLGRSIREDRNRWWLMLFTWEGRGRESGAVTTLSHRTQGRALVSVLFSPPGGRETYHELEEEPGLLQGRLPHSAGAHHPLQGQLLVEQLETRPGQDRTGQDRNPQAEDTQVRHGKQPTSQQREVNIWRMHNKVCRGTTLSLRDVWR